MSIVAEPVVDARLALIPLRKRGGGIAGYALIDARDAWLARKAWHMSPDGYASGQDGRRTVYMHRIIAGATAGTEVDHINRNRLDNRRVNLRVTDRAGNAKNRTPGRSRYRGIRQLGSFWGVRIRDERLHRILTGFETAEDAALAYDMAAIALFGVDTPTNFDYGEGLQGLDEAAREMLSKFAPDWLDDDDERERSRTVLDELVAHAADALRVS